MKIKGGKLKENLSFSSYILIVCILIVVPVLFYICVSDYSVLKDNFYENYNQLQNNTEESIIESIKIVNTGLGIYDETFDDRMKYAFVPFIEAYNNSGGDPKRLDLYSIKEKLGPEYDLYLIDRNHTIWYSTKELDIGLNFSKNKDFSEHLDKIFLSDAYKGDKIVRSVRDTATISKYAYYPSPDGKYILEISFDIKDYREKRDLLQFKTAADTMMNMNPYLMSVKIYDIYGVTVDEPNVVDNPTKKFIIENIIEKKSDLTINNPKDNTVTRYRYVDLYTPDLGTDTSVAIAFTYSNAAIEKELTKILFSKVISFLLFMILLASVFYIATDIVTRPVKNLVEDVDDIGRGNLDHKIRVSGGKEFIKLGKSIENMVERLKSTIDDLKESEATIIKYNEELEEIIHKRTKDLKEANNEANFYIDMMTHDINNANMAAFGYAQFINDSSEGNIKELSEKLISSISHSIDIISNVSLIRTIHNKDVSLRPVSLDDTIKKEIAHFPDMNINYNDSGFYVMADKLLGEVFSNIIGNSKKYAGPDCKIEIKAEEKDGDIIVCIDDNGPGISDGAKDNAFDRFFREDGKSGETGKGLGLYIVKSLVEKYGGIVSTTDRIPDMPEKGLRICITLKKSDENSE
ncbi:MAG: HAMP domain-containing histidine kinase [Methanomicrobiaceae archaeon]|nr:HAMP domain-containing histidine kinase [Methanomicrobiaceae archaeon]